MLRQIPAKGAHDAKKDLFQGSSGQTDGDAHAHASGMGLSWHLGSRRRDHSFPRSPLGLPRSSFLTRYRTELWTSLCSKVLSIQDHDWTFIRQVDEEINFNIQPRFLLPSSSRISKIQVSRRRSDQGSTEERLHLFFETLPLQFSATFAFSSVLVPPCLPCTV